MRRPKIPLLAIFPAIVVTLVIALPLAVGSYPLRWPAGSLLPVLVTGGRTGHPAASAPAPAPPSAAPTGETPLAHVASSWHSGMVQWGVQVYWDDDRSRTVPQLRRQAVAVANYLVGLKANSVVVTFPFFTGTVTSSAVFASGRTPTPDRLGTVLDVFREAGLRTALRPLLDEKSLGGLPNWRGSLAPADLSAWFASYRTFLVPYLVSAQQHHVTEFVIGAEFSSLEGKAGWQAVVDTGRKYFSGEIGYDANWASYVRGPVDMPVRSLGVDAYFPVDAPDSASVATLVRSWNAWLDRKSTGALPRIVLSEVGIPAMRGAYAAPGDFSSRSTVDPQVQANWYTAVCQVVRQRRMSGVYWWFVNFDDQLSKPSDASLLDFTGRTATERAVRACFGSGYAGPGAAGG
jgi:hypothetical protein